jgi:hypothetical protein
MAERGFISGPMERGFLSGPIDRGLYSSPTENKVDDRKKVEENVSTINNGKVRSKKRSLFDIFKKMKFRKIFRAVAQDKDGGVRVKEPNLDKKNGDASGCHHVFLKGVDGDEESEVFMERKNLQWAQGKAGEDRVQVLISEEHGWLFVGIYDGFNGPDAPEFLVSNLYSILHMELKGCSGMTRKMRYWEMGKWVWIWIWIWNLIQRESRGNVPRAWILNLMGKE